MKVLCYSHHEYVPMAALAEGIQACGHRVVWRQHSMYRSDCYEPCDAAAVFGMKDPVPLILEHQRARNTPVVVMDLGYLKRGTIAAAKQHPDDVFWAVGLNGLTGFAEMPPGPYPPERWELLGIPLHPWRAGGDHILVCGQLPGDAMVRSIEPEQWAFETIEHLRAVTDRPIRYRRHPLYKARPLRGVDQSSNESLDDDLKNCWCVVAYNSTSLVRAIIAGVPVMALGPGSLVEGLALRSVEQIETPITPPREAWAAQLAWRQFTLAELRAGLAWRFHLDRDSLPEWQSPVADLDISDRAEPTKDGADHGTRRGRPAKARASGGDAGESLLSAGG